uniref:asparaginase n=1 Tax=Oncorhynchus tshawytscha TaxID=74940 RepID=A0AAZ3R8G7_ONCTS
MLLCTLMATPSLSVSLSSTVLSPPGPNVFVKALRKLPNLHDEQYALDDSTSVTHTLPLPLTPPLLGSSARIVYTVLEYSPLLDSCNMTTDDWATIGKDIEVLGVVILFIFNDGFVILHGTDTMAYTASALSFMCENLGKPVILTGSQVPIYEMRNDGRDNLLGALPIAGQFVCLYFHNKLYRGNRVTKVDSGSFNAFNSPNLAPLANAEVDIKINWDTVWRANTTSRFRVSTQMNRNVGLLRLFPGITAMTVKSFLQAPMEAIVLETYGSGNAPDNCADLLEEFRNATERGVIIVNCTQCLRGSVTTSYATGKALSDAGLVAGCDMTSEAALCKLSYVLARMDLSIENKRKVGVPVKTHSLPHYTLLIHTGHRIGQERYSRYNKLTLETLWPHPRTPPDRAKQEGYNPTHFAKAQPPHH